MMFLQEKRQRRQKAREPFAKGAPGRRAGTVQRATSITYSYKDYTYESVLTGEEATERVGASMEAHLDPADPRYGSGTGGGEQADLMNSLNHKYTQEHGNFVKGHLLNHDLGGLAVPENLFPITHKANSKHSAKVEQGVKHLLSQGCHVDYSVNVSSLFDDTKNLVVGGKTDTFQCTIRWRTADGSANWGPYHENVSSILSNATPPAGDLTATNNFMGAAGHGAANPWQHDAVGTGASFGKRGVVAYDAAHSRYTAIHDGQGLPTVYADVAQAP